ncbi:AAA family ATPase [Chryseobacterium rhizoplanae]|uniref:AAA family ATPase n=1 Tax=Chryseobacterium rhizoplanae TaxID=1609531 RepID=UPI001CE2EFA8|nr:AAA family ATPase [Chryseobacterium rhizoplanae]UCA61343.1 AAA family ATPase [Chryseobacterium rhizoplanae]
MKILAIRIKNLASLEGVTEINFTEEPLCSAGIFAITGATGAGKSTILDALCLALYGKTPRYLQARETGVEIQDVQGSTLSQGDVRGILRDGTADGFAEVDFRGIDGQNYRATWSVRRARNRADGGIQSDSITLKNLSNAVDMPGRKAETFSEIARLVGLNFEQFTRSVLLAQGDFTAFMKANRDEKSSLLEKLTGTYIYSEISRKIFEKYKAEELLLRDLHVRKEGIVTLSDEERQALSVDQELLESQIKSLEAEIEKYTAGIGWYEQLANFQQSNDEAQNALQVAAENKTSALPRSVKLHAVGQAQQTRSWADALQQAQAQQTDKSILLVSLKETLASLQVQQETLEKQLIVADHQLSTEHKALADAQPLLEKARKLDTLLSEKKEQVSQLKEEAQKANEVNRQHQVILKNKEEAFAALLGEIETISQWQTEQAARKPVAENKDLILSKLEDAHKLLEALQNAATSLAQLQNKIQTTKAQKANIEQHWKQQLQAFEDQQKSCNAQSKTLLAIPIETLNRNKTETDAQVEELIKAQAQWQLYYYAQTECESLKQRLIQDQTDHQHKQALLQELDQQLPAIKAERDTADQLLQQARLASAENVETLREALTEHEPCPVCGSTHHPYVVENPQLEKVLAQLEKAHQEKEQIYLANHSKHQALEQECERLQITIQRQEEVLQAKQSALDIQRQAWEQSDATKKSLSITDAEKAAWIETQLQAFKAKQADLLTQLQTYADQKQALETAKNVMDQLKENTDGLTNQIKDIQNNLSLFQEQQNQVKREQEVAATHLKGIEALLSPYFSASGWMENWKAASATFTDGITTFAEQWKAHTEKLDQCTPEKAALEATLKEMEHQAKALASEAERKTEIHLSQQELYLDLSQQRKDLFAGQLADDKELQLKQAITGAQETFDQLKAKQQQLAIDRTKALTQEEELTAALSTLENAIQKTSQHLLDWLKEYNQKNDQQLSLEALHDLLALGNDWIDTERKALLAIDEELTKANSILTERKQALSRHQQNGASQIPLEELITLNDATKSELEEKKHKKGENSFRLQQDEVNKNRIGELLQSLKAQTSVTENWAKLNEIIGSADGKKFRQIAQEYTLDVLLGYANIHLQALTNRYRIERIPASLGLQVVDQDMGDEVRTVYSLSGGESFLVSLALALGLASLSSSRMKVESLFIDEGFGSLDPNTLNIAMDALERLHNQGRKVGVISHVQEMTERIPVQIKVSKQQSGRSKVEVNHK